jgi:hypothetical protein
MHCCDEAILGPLGRLLGRYGLKLSRLAAGQAIPGSYWGAPEAGLIGATVHVRPDTPLHSVLHEACHAICMDPIRRVALDTDAGGDYSEENAVCYLQVVLAGEVGVTREAICADMDAWGYTFRLGSALSWFEQDAADARAWLIAHGLLDAEGAPTGRARAA